MEENVEFESDGNPESDDEEEFWGEDYDDVVSPSEGETMYISSQKNEEEDTRCEQYEIIHESRLIEFVKKDVSKVMKILFIDEYSAVEVLKYFKWNLEKTLEAFFSQTGKSRDEIFSEIGLTSYLVLPRRIFQQNTQHEEEESMNDAESFECPICFDEKSESVRIFPCNHRFCSDCLRGFFSSSINTSTPSFQCPFYGCSTKLSIGVIQYFINSSSSSSLSSSISLQSSLKEQLLKNYMIHNGHVCFCPHPNCGYCVKLLNPLLLSVNCDDCLMIDCECNRRFCFHCASERNHFPVKCSMMKRWIQKTKGFFSSLEWIETNTKPCPNCGIQITKDGGCNHMVCGQCNTHFCWNCGKTRTTSNHRCSHSIFKTQNNNNNNKRNSSEEKKKKRKSQEEEEISCFQKWKRIEDSLRKEKCFFDQRIFNEQQQQQQQEEEEEEEEEEEWFINSKEILFQSKELLMNCIVFYLFEFSKPIFLLEQQVMKKQKVQEQEQKRIHGNNSKKNNKEKKKKNKEKEQEQEEKELMNELSELMIEKNLFLCLMDQFEDHTERLSFLMMMEMKKNNKNKKKITKKNEQEENNKRNSCIEITNILQNIIQTIQKKY